MGGLEWRPPHNPWLIAVSVMLGTFILAFGWFGFNPGSSLAGTELRVAVVATNTMLASATGALGATLWMWWVRTKKPDPSMMCNGMLAGLVAITCPCAFVSAGGASLLGLIAGVLVVESVFLFDKIGVDDPVGAISVHGVNGAWGGDPSAPSSDLMHTRSPLHAFTLWSRATSQASLSFR